MRARTSPAPMTSPKIRAANPSINCQLGSVTSERPPTGIGNGIVTVVVSEGNGVVEPLLKKAGNKIVRRPLPTSIIKIIPHVINEFLFFKRPSPKSLWHALYQALSLRAPIYYHKYFFSNRSIKIDHQSDSRALPRSPSRPSKRRMGDPLGAVGISCCSSSRKASRVR